MFQSSCPSRTGRLALTAPSPYTHILQGTEHLPKGPFVIVSNHQSFIDPSICSHPLANVNFKTLFKNELLYYPCACGARNPAPPRSPTPLFV